MMIVLPRVSDGSQMMIVLPCVSVGSLNDFTTDTHFLSHSNFFSISIQIFFYTHTKSWLQLWREMANSTSLKKNILIGLCSEFFLRLWKQVLLIARYSRFKFSEILADFFRCPSKSHLTFSMHYQIITVLPVISMLIQNNFTTDTDFYVYSIIFYDWHTISEHIQKVKVWKCTENVTFL